MRIIKPAIATRAALFFLSLLATAWGQQPVRLTIEATESRLADGRFAYHYVATNTGKKTVDSWLLSDQANGYGIAALSGVLAETSAPPGWYAQFVQMPDQPGQLSFGPGTSKTGLQPGASAKGFALVTRERASKLLTLFWSATSGETTVGGPVRVATKAAPFDAAAPRGWYYVEDMVSTIELSAARRPDGEITYQFSVLNSRHEPEDASNVALMLTDSYQPPERAGCGKKIATGLGKTPRLFSPVGWGAKLESGEASEASVLWQPTTKAGESPVGFQLAPGQRLTGFGFVAGRGSADLTGCVKVLFNLGADRMGSPKVVAGPQK